MKIKYFKIILSIIVLISFQICFAQTDNGNNFVKTWAADNTDYTGYWGELGVYAEEGLDIDQNGKKEFIIYDHKIGFIRYDNLQIWEAQGDNDFQLVWQARYDDYQTQMEQGHGLTVADIDFDGNKEVWIATEGSIYIYEWDGTTFESGGGLPQEPTQTLFPIVDNAAEANIRQLRVANLDADPELEIFMGYSFTNGIYCVIGSLPNSDLSNPDWKVEFADDFIPWYVGGININDFDGDGNMEIFTCHIQDESVTRLYESNGADTYEVKFTTEQGTLTLEPLFDDAIADPVFYDFDGDGKNELLIGDIHGKVFIITQDASNGFTDFGSSAWSYLLTLPGVQNNGFLRSGILADLDQDGKMDIYYNDMTAKAVIDLEYQGGPVTDPNSWIAYHIYKGHNLTIGYVHPAWDLDGDGKQELIIAASGEQNENLQVIENQDVTFVQNKISAVTSEYKLHQNYPNPFNASTDISFYVAEPGIVRLEIFSLLGSHISTLIHEQLDVGNHHVRFDAGSLPSGVYLYQLSSNKFTQQKKMLLLR
jgi:hypothetical protein